MSIVAQQGIGFNQNWQDLTASRAFGVTYYNTSGRPRMVMVNADSGGAKTTASVDGVALPFGQVNTGYSSGLLVFVVPIGKSYIVNSSNVLGKWSELV
jgi:hypothetical protein